MPTPSKKYNHVIVRFSNVIKGGVCFVFWMSRSQWYRYVVMAHVCLLYQLLCRNCVLVEQLVKHHFKLPGMVKDKTKRIEYKLLLH